MSRGRFTHQRGSKVISPWVLLAVGMCVGPGCRTSEDSIERWANTQQGPIKLVAVFTHDKYELGLRTRAAMTLVGMRPRGGQRVGLDALLDALTKLPPAERTKLVAELVPAFVQRLGQPANGEVDDTVPFKDAAYSLIADDGAPLIEDAGLQSQLKDALSGWAMADFSRRMDAPQQKVGMQQLLRTLGPSSVKALPSLIKPGEPRIDRMAALVAEIGDPEAKSAASKALVEVGKQVASDAWLAEKTPQLKKANEESGIAVDDKRFAMQLAAYQEEELIRVFSSMKRVGGVAAADYLLAFAADGSRPEKLRAASIAALEGNISKTNPDHVGKILEIAGADVTPDMVRDLALRRVGELPRELVIQRLYGLFKHTNWKVRWLSAELILKMSEGKHISEFMAEVGKVTSMSISEPLRYGKLLGELQGATESDLTAFLAPTNAASVRVSALGYYYTLGFVGQLPTVEPFAADLQKVPACAKDAKDCEWKCADKDIATVGDYVTHCIKPAMQARQQAPAKETEATP
jgi:hypothetical protein